MTAVSLLALTLCVFKVVRWWFSHIENINVYIHNVEIIKYWARPLCMITGRTRVNGHKTAKKGILFNTKRVIWLVYFIVWPDPGIENVWSIRTLEIFNTRLDAGLKNPARSRGVGLPDLHSCPSFSTVLRVYQKNNQPYNQCDNCWCLSNPPVSLLVEEIKSVTFILPCWSLQY